MSGVPAHGDITAMQPTGPHGAGIYGIKCLLSSNFDLISTVFLPFHPLISPISNKTFFFLVGAMLLTIISRNTIDFDLT